MVSWWQYKVSLFSIFISMKHVCPFKEKVNNWHTDDELEVSGASQPLTASGCISVSSVVPELQNQTCRMSQQLRPTVPDPVLGGPWDWLPHIMLFVGRHLFKMALNFVTLCVLLKQLCILLHFVAIYFLSGQVKLEGLCWCWCLSASYSWMVGSACGAGACGAPRGRVHWPPCLPARVTESQSRCSRAHSGFRHCGTSHISAAHVRPESVCFTLVPWQTQMLGCWGLDPLFLQNSYIYLLNIFS